MYSKKNSNKKDIVEGARNKKGTPEKLGNCTAVRKGVGCKEEQNPKQKQSTVTKKKRQGQHKRNQTV